MSEWISVKERLPELLAPEFEQQKYRYSKSVLAYPDSAGEMFVACYWSTGNWCEEHCGSRETPTHWMPLPAPPQEQP